MSYTTDSQDPRLGRGVDAEPIKQHEVYLVLSEEEIAKGFIRPVRRSYVHVGAKVHSTFRMLSDEEKACHDGRYVAFSENDDKQSSSLGFFLTQSDVDSFRNGYINGCGTLTTMGQTIAETYARDPKFYGSTYCVGCSKHLPVSEFVWDGTTETVGS